MKIVFENRKKIVESLKFIAKTNIINSIDGNVRLSAEKIGM